MQTYVPSCWCSVHQLHHISITNNEHCYFKFNKTIQRANLIKTTNDLRPLPISQWLILHDREWLFCLFVQIFKWNIHSSFDQYDDNRYSTYSVFNKVNLIIYHLLAEIFQNLNAFGSRNSQKVQFPLHVSCLKTE